MLEIWEPQCPYNILKNINNKKQLEEIFEMPYNDILQYYYDLRKDRTYYAHSF
jgi:hypothetical protein